MNALCRQLIAIAAACWLVLPPGWCCVLLGAEWTRAGLPEPTETERQSLPTCCQAAHGEESCHNDQPTAPANPAEHTGKGCLCLAAADEAGPIPQAVVVPDAPLGFVAILPVPLSIDPPGLSAWDESTLSLPTLSASGRRALLCVWRC